MDLEKLNKIIENVNEKAGETSSLFADDLADLVTENATAEKEKEELEQKISNLETQKESLILSNGNLLKKVQDETNIQIFESSTEKEEKKEISFDEIFDEKGNLK